MTFLQNHRMARHEADREDLIREAVALKTRIEWDVPGEPEPVVTGVRADLSLSVFFGQDPVYHFNPEGQLRRAFVDGFLFRTQRDTLARLHRKRSESETTLLRNDLTEAELAEFLAAMRTRLAALRDALQSEAATELRSVIDESLVADFPVAIQTAESASPPLAPAIAARR